MEQGQCRAALGRWQRRQRWWRARSNGAEAQEEACGEVTEDGQLGLRFLATQRVSLGPHLNASSKSSPKRWLLLISIAVCIAAVVAAAGVYWQRRWQHGHPAAKLMTLPEALWVTERDCSRFYAPGTPE